MLRYLALLLACLFLILAIIGIFLPGLPTVPFLLLAAWFSARSSPRLHQWLHRHPIFGKLLTDWETNKSISRKSKIIAVLMLMLSYALMLVRVDNSWILISVGLLFLLVAVFLVSRPEPHRIS
ncbi:YbaN family protein [Undibacterium amnicola]|uniref:YbaN family protein n=1 Tax=Undibacterium amnicola TaxID=1834038 RepID=A0ABR6XSQ9_9BURK|nr:YbaN family protein [Undibacterium amnicola]MBC3832487.1 YbaN family protein [Undibacterium amnicola]